MAITSFPDINREVPFEPLPETNSGQNWVSLSIIITGIATVIILSYASVLPAYFILTAKISILTTLVSLLLSAAFHVLTKSKENEVQVVNENEDAVTDMTKNPFTTCIVAPVVEEGIFRGLIQSGLQKLFFRILPASMICAFPLPALVAIGISSLLFGVAHISNNLKLQPTLAALKSAVVYGPLFYHYGLYATIFAHCLNNTVATTIKYSLTSMLTRKEENPPNEMVKV
jgi:membrane protease YdiL (CAAX protease family)